MTATLPNCRIVLPLAALLLSACITTSQQGPRVGAVLESRSASSVRGVVSFTQIPEGLQFKVDVTGLTPGEHSIAVHEVGDCSAPDAASAKGRFTLPGVKPQTAPMSQEKSVGALLPLYADLYGTARMSYLVQGFTLTGDTGIVGRSIVVETRVYDARLQRTSNTGIRIACGVINPA